MLCMTVTTSNFTDEYLSRNASILRCIQGNIGSPSDQISNARKNISPLDTTGRIKNFSRFPSWTGDTWRIPLNAITTMEESLPGSGPSVDTARAMVKGKKANRISECTPINRASTRECAPITPDHSTKTKSLFFFFCFV